MNGWMNEYMNELKTIKNKKQKKHITILITPKQFVYVLIVLKLI